MPKQPITESAKFWSNLCIIVALVSTVLVVHLGTIITKLQKDLIDTKIERGVYKDALRQHHLKNR